ncbi:hypothetical protein BC938DRAFT_473042 [Jimgerdemannia flammicorona]|uniref:Uncharacterized protein n=1 Tax=Jimgerdemannia flammicorona TaxID=994334 RepID=A0A433QTJ6_9FUNG|nr:hypothetical protein BC938DRAFT_473042 [Jimgerdemannia flammicorona]
MSGLCHIIHHPPLVRFVVYCQVTGFVRVTIIMSTTWENHVSNSTF